MILDRYSVVLSEYGWAIKCLTTGKELTGKIDDIPYAAYYDLLEKVDMSDNSVCTATEIQTPYNSPFTVWFRVTHRCLI